MFFLYLLGKWKKIFKKNIKTDISDQKTLYTFTTFFPFFGKLLLTSVCSHRSYKTIHLFIILKFQYFSNFFFDYPTWKIIIVIVINKRTHIRKFHEPIEEKKHTQNRFCILNNYLHANCVSVKLWLRDNIDIFFDKF